jgi:biotin synthase
MFDPLLEKAQTQPTEELALKIWEASHFPLNARKLFRAASSIRDRHLGNIFSWVATIDGAALRDNPLDRRDELDISRKDAKEFELRRTLQALKHFGFRRLRLDLTTSGSGCDWELISMAETLKTASEFSIEISVRTPPRRQTARRLKDLGVCRVLCDCGPAGNDSILTASSGEMRDTMKALFEVCEEVGLPVVSGLRIGLSERCESRIHRLFLLAQLKSLHRVRFSCALPPALERDTNHSRFASWELARIIAIARLILPDAQISLDGHGSATHIPLWIHSGGGSQMIGASIVGKGAFPESIPDSVPAGGGLSVVEDLILQRKQVEAMGYRIGFCLPSPSAGSIHARHFTGCPKH